MTAAGPVREGLRRRPGRSGGRRGDVIRLVVLVAFVAVALVRAPDPVGLLMDTSLVALAAVGVGLVLGLAGQPTLCQAAFMLVGAYAYTLTSRSAGPALPTLVGLLAACTVGVAIAALLSPVMRARGYLLALATIALDLFVRQAFRTGTWLPGREAGLADVPPLSLFGYDLVRPGQYLALGVAALVVIGTVLHLRYGRGREARALKVLAGDQDLLAELGQSPERRKRELFVIAGGLGALAGAITVASFGFVGPTSFTSADSFALAVAVVIGGRDRIGGAVVGAVVYQMTAPLLGPELAGFQPLLLGATVIACMHWFPDGLLPRLRGGGVHVGRPGSPERVAPSRTGSTDAGSTATASTIAGGPFEGSVAGLELVLRGVTCDFGSLRAVDHVDLRVGPGSVTALVGPNGAGKSTLLAAIAGELRPQGDVEMDGRDVTRQTARPRALTGVSRSHQHVRLVEGMTALDSVLVGVDLGVRRGAGERPGEAERRDTAVAALAGVGAAELAGAVVDDLSFVQRRFVDLARLVASHPRLALLDEPSAGLDHEERDRVVDVVERLAATGCTVVLVEHDLAFVRALARRVVALVEGRVIADGSVDEVFALAEFEAAYLGGAA